MAVANINSTIVSDVYTSRINLIEQLENRGFNVDNYEGFSVNEIHVMLMNKQLDILVEDENGKKVFVKYFIHKSLRPNHIYQTIDDLFNIENILSPQDELLFVTKDDPNDTLKKLIKEIYNNDDNFINVVGIKRLQFNILKHRLVPTHIPLSDDEKKDVMDKFNISSESQIPEISRFDPVSVAIGLRPKQMCKIIRNSKTAIDSNFYRICV